MASLDSDPGSIGLNERELLVALESLKSALDHVVPEYRLAVHSDSDDPMRYLRDVHSRLIQDIGAVLLGLGKVEIDLE